MDSPRIVRRRCKGCYDFNVGIWGSKTAKNKTTKVSTYCVQCRGFFCISCFNGIHHGLVGFKNKKMKPQIQKKGAKEGNKKEDAPLEPTDQVFIQQDQTLWTGNVEEVSEVPGDQG